MSLAPKIEELHAYIANASVDILCIVETWLQNHIDDNIVSLPGYNLILRDRRERIHGGVCVYIRNTINFNILHDFSSNEFEALWLDLRPTRLPRGVSNIILCNLYHPPGENDQSMINYLFESLVTLETEFPNSGIILSGDFNKLNVRLLKNSFKLRQIVNFPTRGNNILDLILTNMEKFYDSPIKRPPFGLSDHVTVEIQPLKRPKNSGTKLKNYLQLGGRKSKS
jgi:exonuclease III